MFRLATLLILVAMPALAEGLTGPARVVDGDTLWVGEAEVRLHGIDAPELDQVCITRKGENMMCGVLSKQALAGWVRGADVRCEAQDTDPQGLTRAVCYVGWLNINETMVADGWAMADRRSSEKYVRAETFAKARREGIWRTEFVPPWEWRGK